MCIPNGDEGRMGQGRETLRWQGAPVPELFVPAQEHTVRPELCQRDAAQALCSKQGGPAVAFTLPTRLVADLRHVVPLCSATGDPEQRAEGRVPGSATALLRTLMPVEAAISHVCFA